MRFSAGRAILVLVSLFCGAGLSSAQTVQVPRLVERIDIKNVGPPAASDDLIRTNIRLKVGEPYLRSSADDDVRSLYATGYFYNIRIGEQLTDTGVVLTYVVQGKPILTEIRFQGGTKYSRTKMLKKIKSKVGEPLNERLLFVDAEELKKLYQKDGYYETEVKYAPPVIDEQAGRGSVTFEISEKPKVRVVDVQFVNANYFTPKKLRGLLKTERWWMFSWITGSGKLRQEDFEEDKELLVEFYRSNGYIDFAIKDVQMDFTLPTRLIIRFILSEGVKYRIGSIGFKGNNLFTDELLRSRLPVGVGNVFTPLGLFRDQGAVEDMYGARGYVDARIGATKVANTERGTMDLIFNIDEKQQSFIEKIDIKGNTKTKDMVIRRELAVSPGEVFDMVRVKLSTNRLAGLNYFAKVEARPEPTDVPNRKNLVIGVEEKSTGNFTIGAGFSSVDNLVGFVEVTQGNFDLFNPWFFTGGGQKFRLRAQIGTERQDYVMSFIEPWFLGRKLALGVELFSRDLQYQSSLYDETRLGGRVSLTRTLGSDFLIGNVFYTLENVGINRVTLLAPDEIKAAAAKSPYLISKIGGGLAYDTRNSTTLPNGGHRTEVLAEIAGLGGNTSFYKLELRTAWYFKGLAPGHVLEVVARGGVAQAYGDDLDVPIFERYYLGGLYNLRGFEYRTVGPSAGASLEPIGGDTMYYGSIEYSIPILDKFRLAFFYDIGMVFAKPYSFNPDPYKTGVYNSDVGIGIRLNLPIGPLRLDYAIPLSTGQFNDNGGQFQFGVGYTREL